MVFQADQLSDFSEVKLSYLFVRMQVLSHCRNTHTVYNAYTCTQYRMTRAYCKLQKLLPQAKLISKYTSWHLMPSVTEVRAKDPAGGLKFLPLGASGYAMKHQLGKQHLTRALPRPPVPSAAVESSKPADKRSYATSSQLATPCHLRRVRGSLPESTRSQAFYALTCPHPLTDCHLFGCIH